MNTNSKSWFEVDRKGLSNLVANRDKSFIINELIQNAWDQDVSQVTVELVDSNLRGFSVLTVEDDDPNGFSDMAHAFTLFAESEKKGDATKRGRFNLGEKLVLSVCRSATIESVGRSVVFNEAGDRAEFKNKRLEGSCFTAVIPMTDVQRQEVLDGINRLIQPETVTTTVNGTPLVSREPVASFTTQMPTVAMDDEGNLFNTRRMTRIDIYEPLTGESASIYEMGIPIVEFDGDRFHVDVQQKVPMNMDRDNVSPSYLSRLRMSVVNETHHLLTEDDASSTWVKDATGHPESSDEAVNKTLDLCYGTKRVIANPNDPEANAIAVSKGYTLIHGRSLTGDQHARVRESGAAYSSSKVTPAPSPFSEDGEPLKRMDSEKWTPEMVAVHGLAERLAQRVLKADIDISFANEIKWPFAATYGPRSNGSRGDLIINVGSVGYAFFKEDNLTAILDLLIHEFAHHYASSHFSEEYWKALSLVGARTAVVALREPAILGL